MAIISTKSIEALKKNPAKLQEIKTPNNLKEVCSTSKEYISALSTAIFTLIADTEDKSKYACITKLTTVDDKDPDLSYLIQLLTKNEKFDFDIVSVIDLYESMLRENWNNVKKERAILNSLKFTDKTAETNMEICKTIVRFLKQNILNNENNYTI